MQFGLVRKDLPGFSSNFCFVQYIEAAKVSHKHRQIMSLVFFPAEYSTIPLFLFAMALPLIHSVMQTAVFFCCFFMCDRLTPKRVPSLLQEQPVQKSFLSIPEITALMCKAFKNQCTARVCSLTAMFVLFS